MIHFKSTDTSFLFIKTMVL